MQPGWFPRTLAAPGAFESMATDPLPAFCTECGSALAIDSRFCEQCGSRVGPPALPTPTRSPSAEEAGSPPLPAPSVGKGSPSWLFGVVGALVTLLILTVVLGAWICLPRLGQHQEPQMATPPQAETVASASHDGAPAPDPAADGPTEDEFERWFETQGWYRQLLLQLPEGVTWGFHGFPDEEHPGETMVEVREFHAPDSGYDPNVSPMVGLFRVSADRARVLWLDPVEAGWRPLDQFLASRQPAPAPAEGALPEPPANMPSDSPVELVYRSFMDEAYRSRGGNLRAGDPFITEHRIDTALTVDGATLAYVFVEIANDGETAEVLVGPQDAGADRTYTLRNSPNGWVITGFEEGEH